MRRAVPALITTVIGLGALASFKAAPGSAIHISSAPVTPTTTPATTPPRTPATVPSARAPNTNAPSTTPTTVAPAAATRTIDGDAYQNRYGTVQVRVTL